MLEEAGPHSLGFPLGCRSYRNQSGVLCLQPLHLCFCEADYPKRLQLSTWPLTMVIWSSDYATRYPEAVPPRSCDTEQVLKALVNIYACVGVPKEILSDQGMNFTSQLMKEIQNLLHVKAI